MNNKIEYVLFFILIILLLMIITINSKKKVKLYEFFIEPTKTTVNNQNKNNQNKNNQNNQNKRVTIASLKNTEIEENTEQEEDTVKPVNSKLSKCPEGYAFQQNRCEKVCHHCKLGKCEYGICY